MTAVVVKFQPPRLDHGEKRIAQGIRGLLAHAEPTIRIPTDRTPSQSVATAVIHVVDVGVVRVIVLVGSRYGLCVWTRIEPDRATICAANHSPAILHEPLVVAPFKHGRFAL